MQTYIDQVFDSNGYLDRFLTDYQVRDGQIDLACEVEAALLDSTNLVAEAPTGSGKSFAYLVPAVRWAVESERTVVVATANIALQEQLVQKDLPFLSEVLPYDFSFALAKGRSNYLCWNALDDARAEIRKGNHVFDDLSAVIDRWVHETHTGDVSELAERETRAVWSKYRQHYTSSANDCLGKECPFRETCFAELAKQCAASSHIVVSNYHLLFAHMKVMEATNGFVGALPPFAAIVCDEAHKLADIAREFFGDKITRKAIERVGAHLPMGERFAFEHKASTFFNWLGSYAKKRERPRLRERLPEDGWHPVYNAIMSAGVHFLQQANATTDAKAKGKFTGYSNRAMRLGERLCELCAVDDDDQTYFVEVDRKGDPMLCSRVVNVAPVLARDLWNTLSSTTLTSATLSVGGAFDYVVNETGLPDPKCIEIETPFDFFSQCALVVPHLPTPNSASWPDRVVDAIVEVIEAAQGRTLCLFTSYRMLDHVHRALEARALPFRILRQAESAERSRLVREFKSEPSSVLLGTESFWAGVDVPGESCSVVVIDKLPFPTPSDPVLEALNERAGKSAFRVHSIPRAVIQFKQGFGRLIRRDTDRGAVVVLDPRIIDKPYGRKFLNSLPEVAVYHDLDKIREIVG